MHMADQRRRHSVEKMPRCGEERHRKSGTRSIVPRQVKCQWRAGETYPTVASDLPSCEVIYEPCAGGEACQVVMIESFFTAWSVVQVGSSVASGRVCGTSSIEATETVQPGRLIDSSENQP